MSIALDGFKVLKRLGDAPETFAAVRVDVDKAARALVVKCLKTKSVGLATVRKIHGALHDKQFELIIEGLKDAELKSLVARLDKHHPGLKTQSSHERRRHLLALTSGAAEPSPAVAKMKAKKSSAKKAKIEKQPPKRLQSDVMDLFRARGKMQDED